MITVGLKFLAFNEYKYSQLILGSDFFPLVYSLLMLCSIFHTHFSPYNFMCSEWQTEVTVKKLKKYV